MSILYIHRLRGRLPHERLSVPGDVDRGGYETENPTELCIISPLAVSQTVGVEPGFALIAVEQQPTEKLSLITLLVCSPRHSVLPDRIIALLFPVN